MTLATEFAETTRRLATLADMHRRVIHLYRKYVRNAKEIQDLYELDMPVASVKTKIRQEFERQRYIEDLGVKNVLYAKGQMEFQELLNFWKQQCHVMKYFDQPTQPVVNNQSEFITAFLKGNN